MIELTPTPVYKLSYHELEAIVCEAYGWEPDPARPYDEAWSFVADQEGRNDTAYNFDGVEGKLADYQRKKLAEILAGERSRHGWNARIYLEDLAGKGIISKGDYLITVSW